MLNTFLNILALGLLVAGDLLFGSLAAAVFTKQATKQNWRTSTIEVFGYIILATSAFVLGLIAGRILDFLFIILLVCWEAYTFVFKSNTSLSYSLPRTFVWILSFAAGWLTNPKIVVCAKTCMPLYKLIINGIASFRIDW